MQNLRQRARRARESRHIRRRCQKKVPANENTKISIHTREYDADSVAIKTNDKSHFYFITKTKDETFFVRESTFVNRSETNIRFWHRFIDFWFQRDAIGISPCQRAPASRACKARRAVFLSHRRRLNEFANHPDAAGSLIFATC